MGYWSDCIRVPLGYFAKEPVQPGKLGREEEEGRSEGDLIERCRLTSHGTQGDHSTLTSSC